MEPKTEYVVGFAFADCGTRVLLIHKLKPKWQRGLLNGVGGKIEDRETSAQAMAREFEEEAGIPVNPKDWRKFAEIIGTNYVIHCFMTHLGGTQALRVLSVTDEQVTWYRTADLPSLPTLMNLKWLSPLALDRDLVTASVDDPSGDQ